MHWRALHVDRLVGGKVIEIHLVNSRSSIGCCYILSLRRFRIGPKTVVSGTDLPHLVSGRPGYHAVLAFAIRPVAGTVARYEGIDDETTDRGIGSGCPGSGRFGRRGHRSEED